MKKLVNRIMNYSEKLEALEPKENLCQVSREKFAFLLSGVASFRKVPGIPQHMGFEGLYHCDNEQDAYLVREHLQRIYNVKNKETLISVCNSLFSGSEEYEQIMTFFRNAPVFNINELKPHARKAFERCKEMASYLQIENISKSYGPKILFEKIGFNINEGDKIALIAPNGTGKTSLMRILAGKDKSDSGGKIMFLKDIKIAFLEQDYPFDPEKSIFDQVMSSSIEFTKDLDQEHLWEYEHRVVKFLTNFNLNNPDQKMKELSGGEIKRVALTQMLASEADFFIMDEPTNHLDIDALAWLESFLSTYKKTVIIISHDRYFLDRTTNKTAPANSLSIKRLEGAEGLEFNIIRRGGWHPVKFFLRFFARRGRFGRVKIDN